MTEPASELDAMPSGDATRKPVPDPTSLTTDNMRREIMHLKTLIEAQMADLRQSFDEYKQGHIERHHDVVNSRIEQVRLDAEAKLLVLRDAIRDKSEQLDLRYEQRYQAQRDAVDSALEAAEKANDKAALAIARKFETLEHGMATVAMLTDRADALGERIESVKSVTAATFVTYRTLVDSEANKVELALSAADKALAKAEHTNETRFEGIEKLRAAVAEQAHSFVPRQESDQRFLSLNARLDALINGHDVMLADIKGRLDRSEGKSGGYASGAGALIAGIGVIATLITIVTAIILVVN